MSNTVTLPYKGGLLTVPRYSRIKVYKLKGSLKGYLDSFNNKELIIIVPYNYEEFHEGSLPRGKKITIKREFLLGYSFYPEISLFSLKEKREDVKK
ncbi:MAG: hypothetical protein QXV17_07725 [Candidatus Micrarchaeaceae archaeon]